MKAYNKYMDKISVSSELHQKIMSCTNSGAKHLPIVIKHYTAVFACLCVAFLGVLTIQKFMQHNVVPTPGNNQSVLETDTATPAPDISRKYTLYFNKADGQAADKSLIPGHFWQELTADEIKAVFPTIKNTRNIKATANFQSDENGIALYNIDAHAISDSGLKTHIQLAPYELVLDYSFDSEAKSSDVLETTVTAGYYETAPNSKGLKNIICFAAFKLSDIAYYVELSGTEANKKVIENEISEIIGLLIEGGAADIGILNPIAPELRDIRLSLDEARTDKDFGSYLPMKIPAGFVFQDAQRFINQEQNRLSANWAKGMGYINWRVSFLDDNDKTRITSVADTKNYDLSLYPIPRADSVPDELREIVNNPVFLIDELSLDTVRARTYEISDSGDEPGARMRFGVLYGDILVELSIKGATPEAMFEILQKIKNNT